MINTEKFRLTCTGSPKRNLTNLSLLKKKIDKNFISSTSNCASLTL